MKQKINFFILLFIIISSAAPAQVFLSRSAALDSAFKNNPNILAAQKNIESHQALRKGSLMFEKTDFWIEGPTATRFALGIQQYLSFPNVYANQIRLQKENVKLAEKELQVSKNTLGRNLESVYLQMQYSLNRLVQLKYQDSIYAHLFKATEKRYSVGEAEYLEKVLEESKYREVNNLLSQTYKEIESNQAQLLMMTGIAADSITVEALLKSNSPSYSRKDTSYLSHNPLIGYYANSKIISERFFRVQKANFFPNVFVGYLNQGYSNSEVLYRLRFGIAIPLWFPAYTSKIKAARIGIDIAGYQYESAINRVRMEYYKAYSNLEKNKLNVQYFEERALKQSDEILKTSTRLYEIGEISYFNYLMGLTQSMEIRMRYLDALRDYNQSVIDLNYIRGE